VEVTPPRPLRVRLLVTAGPDLGRALELDAGTYFVGRGAGCDLLLSDIFVSRKHLELAVLEDAIRVQNLGAAGSFVGGARFESIKVEAGATLRIGRTELTFVADAAAAPAILGTTLDALPHRFGALRSESPGMRRIFAYLERAAATEAVVLIQGETGTGKELVAEAIHAASARRRGPFVVCDLGSMPRGVIESELFGHVRGAFTGADRDRKGAFAVADRGTLFLDEIGELELDGQPRLLRAIERRQFKPVGASAFETSDVRVIAATNRDLAAEARAGRFREDLYHRLAVVRVALPPLRERREDIPLLVSFFLERAAAASGRPAPLVPPETMAALRGHDWPGNIRELRNVLERASTLAPGPVLDAHVIGIDEIVARAESSSPVVDMTAPFKEAKDRLVLAWEREYVTALLVRCHGNVSLAARTGGLDRVYLHRLMKKHGLGER
jgi:DNA-binding NtrC family response regulator